ncbi:MAG: molybdate ABC transporter permease subunit [Chitinophagaceae bacterium]
MIQGDYLQTLMLTFKLAGLTTGILLLIGIPLAWFLTYTTLRFKPLLEALVSMPLVLPPTVLGYYLLIAFSTDTMFGKFLFNQFGIRLNFSFEGILIGSVLYSLPFMIHPLQSGFQHLPQSLREASYTLGKSSFTTLTRVLLPNIKPSLISGIVLSFAHTIGEFGVILMIGGNIKGQTRVASIAIYDEVESLHYHSANIYASILLMISFMMLFVLFWYNKQFLSRKVL